MRTKKKTKEKRTKTKKKEKRKTLKKLDEAEEEERSGVAKGRRGRAQGWRGESINKRWSPATQLVAPLAILWPVSAVSFSLLLSLW